MLFHEFNTGEKIEAGTLLQKCCGLQKWREEVLKQFPYPDQCSFIEAINSTWYESCVEADWKEAFLHHPEIGDIDSLQEKYAASRDIAGKEQEGVNDAGEETLRALLKFNKAYKEKFGFIFIVYASGKSAGEMLELLKVRLGNDHDDELRIAMGEQHKITMKRLKDQLTDLQITVSQITTHILDTSNGRPAEGVAISLQLLNNGKAETITQGITNRDGRAPDLLPPGRMLEAGIYKMQFKTGDYFSRSGVATFFPFADINFIISNQTHYHIPLLISPFGFTTYRGS